MQGFAQDAFIPFRNQGLHCHPACGRRGDNRQFTDARHRHVQRPGDGRGGQREQVDFGAQLLQALFLLYAETLFFIDDYQPQFPEANVFLDQAVRADHDIHLAAGKLLQDLAGLLAGAEA